jgi:hypothetical protein
MTRLKGNRPFMDCIFKINSVDRRQVHWEDHLRDLTPIENIGGMWWKREDKFAPLGYGNINGSKLRQLIWLFSQKQYPGVVSGAVTGSPQLPMVAACAKHWNISCVQVIGGRPESSLKHEMVKIGVELGAKSVFCNPGYAATLNSKALEMSRNGMSGYLHVETNITVCHKVNPPEQVEAFHRVGSEQIRNVPNHIQTLILPAGSCNTLVSVLYGLGRFRPKSVKNVILLRISPSADKKRKWTKDRLAIIEDASGTPLRSLPYNFIEHDLVGRGYTTYADTMKATLGEIVFHERYEAKCVRFMWENRSAFQPFMNDGALFWIVGSKPNA